MSNDIHGIPKIIHYCWFGGKPLPDSAIKCIDSWKRFMPDFEIKQWDESNFDVYSIPYTSEAYKRKMYAFVSDYARFWILEREGGVYLDTDVELLKSLDDILLCGPYMGIEEGKMIAPGLGMGALPSMDFLKDMIRFYKRNSLLRKDGSINYDTVVLNTTWLLEARGWTGSEVEIAGFKIYSSEYFCPLNYKTGILNITDKTYSIHHYQASWVTGKAKLYQRIKTVLGEDFAKKCSKIYQKIQNKQS